MLRDSFKEVVNPADSDALVLQASSMTGKAGPVFKKIPWNPLAAIVAVVVIYFISQVLGGVLVSVYPALKHWTPSHSNDWVSNSVIAQFLYVLIVEAITLAGLWIFLRRYKSSFQSIGFLKPKAIDPPLSVVGFVGYFAIYAVAVSIMSHLIPALNVTQQQDVGFNNVSGILPLILTFISLVILPPITEEILLRGFLFGSLRKKLPFILAALVTSALFASAHLDEGANGSGLLWIAFIDTFVLSMVSCYIRERTGRLSASIGLHMIKNGVAFISLFLLHTH